MESETQKIFESAWKKIEIEPKEEMSGVKVNLGGVKRKRIALKKIACPSCGGLGTLRKILYGMPGEDFDFEKYEVGGCIVEVNDVSCKECGWFGVRKELFGG